jgi:hypothetical protein
MQAAGAYERVVMRSPAFVDRGWLPPADDCAELADLRAEHERLLDVVADALAKVRKAREEIDGADEKRAVALRDAIAAGKSPASVVLEKADEQALKGALGVYDAACAVLEMFVRNAEQQIVERAPVVRDGFATSLREAEAKRAEARRLLHEASRLEAEPKRLLNWLDRYTTVEDPESGEQRKASWLGPIAYEAMDLPVREPVPPLFEEIAGLAPATVIEVGSDEVAPEELEAISHG